MHMNDTTIERSTAPLAVAIYIQQINCTIHKLYILIIGATLTNKGHAFIRKQVDVLLNTPF